MNEEEKKLLEARIETTAYQKLIEKLLVSTKTESETHSVTADNLQKKLVFINLLTLICIAFLFAVQAKDSITNMAISAIVVANAKMQIVHQEDQINITKENIDKGYVEIPTAITFSIKTNSPQGFIMDFIPVGSVFESVKMSGISDLPELNSNGGSVVHRGLISKDIVYELSFKFKLKNNILPGKYPWPLQISLHVIS